MKMLTAALTQSPFTKTGKITDRTAESFPAVGLLELDEVDDDDDAHEQIDHTIRMPMRYYYIITCCCYYHYTLYDAVMQLSQIARNKTKLS